MGRGVPLRRSVYYCLILLILMSLESRGAGATPQANPHVLPLQTDAWYSVTLQVPRTIFPHQAVEVRVYARTRHGQPVDGLPVEFLLRLQPRQHVRLIPSRTQTRQGKARAVLRVSSVGQVRLSVRVGTIWKHTDLAIILPFATLCPPGQSSPWLGDPVARTGRSSLFFAGIQPAGICPTAERLSAQYSMHAGHSSWQ